LYPIPKLKKQQDFIYLQKNIFLCIMNVKSKKILLGMSGGTDSSVSAILLQQQGYEVMGVTFRFWEEKKDIEPADIQDARDLAHKLGIEHRVYDARDVFQTKVVDYFIDEYLLGRTPFPCIKCNNYLKWDLLLNLANEWACDYIATGHYAKIVEENGFLYVAEAADKDKDQTFFLWGLRQEILRKAILPLGNYTKIEIRKMAAELGYQKVATKKDSMGVCFCKGDYRDFLKKQDRSKSIIKKGNFVDEAGLFLGRHEGYPFYTIGQRHGLGIALKEPVFVKKILPEKNILVLAPIEDVYEKEIILNEYNLINEHDFSDAFDVITKIRYRKQATLSRIKITQDKLLKIELAEPVSSIASGQSAVFYRDGKVLGGGIIQ
jgi:tRNA-specific 2-thiouridylase